MAISAKCAGKEGGILGSWGA